MYVIYVMLCYVMHCVVLYCVVLTVFCCVVLSCIACMYVCYVCTQVNMLVSDDTRVAEGIEAQFLLYTEQSFFSWMVIVELCFTAG